MESLLILVLVALFANVILSAHRSSSFNESEVRTSFKKWPHSRIFDGYLITGDWHAGDLALYKNRISYSSAKNIDRVQNSSIYDGWFLPSSNFPKFHIFSAKEASHCLRGRKIFFMGDSYIQSMFIGLVEILLEKPSNEEIADPTTRKKVVADMSAKIDHFASKFVVKYLFEDCRRSDLKCLLTSLKNSTEWKDADSIVANILIGHLEVHRNEDDWASNYISDLVKLFLVDNIKLTWTTGPSYNTSRVAEQFRNPNTSRPTELLNFEAVNVANRLGIPVLDFFTMTHHCKWKNCSIDGGHGTRFVNRMKAQMYLNNLCKFSGNSANHSASARPVVLPLLNPYTVNQQIHSPLSRMYNSSIF